MPLASTAISSKPERRRRPAAVRWTRTRTRERSSARRGVSADDAYASITHPAMLLALLGEHAYDSATDEPDVETGEGASCALKEPPSQRSGNDEERLCRSHLELAHALARHVHAQAGACVDLETLFSAARMGLFDAARRYDAARGIPFGFFAKHRILGALLDELRAEHVVKRSTIRRPAELRALLHGCSGLARRDRLVEEESLAWISAWQSLYGVRTIPIDGTLALSGVVDDDAERADAVIEREERFARVRAAVAELEPRDRALIEHVFFDERSIVAVGAATGLSRSWTCRLVNEALDRLRCALRRTDAREAFSFRIRRVRQQRRARSSSWTSATQALDDR